MTSVLLHRVDLHSPKTLGDNSIRLNFLSLSSMHQASHTVSQIKPMKKKVFIQGRAMKRWLLHRVHLHTPKKISIQFNTTQIFINQFHALYYSFSFPNEANEKKACIQFRTMKVWLVFFYTELTSIHQKHLGDNSTRLTFLSDNYMPHARHTVPQIKPMKKMVFIQDRAMKRWLLHRVDLHTPKKN